MVSTLSRTSVSPSRSPEPTLRVSPPTPRKPREEIHFLLLLQKTEERFSRFASDGLIQDPKVIYFVTELQRMLEELKIHAQ